MGWNRQLNSRITVDKKVIEEIRVAIIMNKTSSNQCSEITATYLKMISVEVQAKLIHVMSMLQLLKQRKWKLNSPMTTCSILAVQHILNALLRKSWTTRRTNHSILFEVKLDSSLRALRVNLFSLGQSLEKALKVRKNQGNWKGGWQDENVWVVVDLHGVIVLQLSWRHAVQNYRLGIMIFF